MVHSFLLSSMSPCCLQVYAHDPRPGDLIIFPGWLKHRVEPTLEPEDTIPRGQDLFQAPSRLLRVACSSPLALPSAELPLPESCSFGEAQVLLHSASLVGVLVCHSSRNRTAAPPVSPPFMGPR